jgi:hypothetical protein
MMHGRSCGPEKRGAVWFAWSQGPPKHHLYFNVTNCSSTHTISQHESTGNAGILGCIYALEKAKEVFSSVVRAASQRLENVTISATT